MKFPLPGAVAVCLFLCHLFAGCGERETETAAEPAGPPLSVGEALSFFQFPKDLRIDAVAAEPLVVDPVAFAFDEKGRLYVVEHRGYPDPVGPGAEPTHEGRIALLEDTDGDGRFDRRSEFATGLTYPNGIMVWKGGVFVTCAPDLLYLKDHSGDGKADDKKVVLTGFSTSQTAQIRFSHPTLGPDGWIYLTSGLNGGKIQAPDHPDRPPVEFTRSDSRFHPETLRFETVGGRGQYGLTFDDYGRRFVCSNRHPVLHVVMEPGELARNPHLPPANPVHEVSAAGDAAVVYPMSRDGTTASYMSTLMSRPHAGTFTAASGVFIHRGDGLPSGYEGNVFICESAQNLVQRQLLAQTGPTFRSEPVHEKGEFLASPDHWFRPVYLGNGPDGAIYIADMYRGEIDHPHYLPDEVAGKLDFGAGKNRGRIYRVAARDLPPGRSLSSVARLAAASSEDLAAALSHPNAWIRETAFRLILERRDETVLPALRTIRSTADQPLQRLHALRLIGIFSGLSEEDLLQAMRDSDPGIREHAIRSASLHFSEEPEILTRTMILAEDQNLRVRFAAALALGEFRNPEAIEALAKVAAADGYDPWMRLAVLSSIGGRAEPFFAAFRNQPDAPMAARNAVLADLANLFGAGESPEACRQLLGEIFAEEGAPFETRASAASGMARGLRRRGFAAEGQAPLTALFENAPPAEVGKKLFALFEEAAAIAREPEAGIETRRAAVELLVHGPPEKAGAALLHLVGPHVPGELQIAAIRSLFQLPVSGIAPKIYDRQQWSILTPSVREAALEASFSRSGHLKALLAAIDSGDIPIRSLSPQMRDRLRRHADEEIRTAATALLEGMKTGNRMQLYEDLKPVLELSPDLSNGRRVFEQNCAACHTHRGSGRNVGPDLSGIRNQSPDTILLHAIVPDFEITSGYEAYLVEMRDGRSLFGLITAETESSITLRNLVEEELHLPRSDIARLSVSATSLMPEGLERQMTRQELADLIGYLRSPPAD